jgi:hypothetical protein
LSGFSEFRYSFFTEKFNGLSQFVERIFKVQILFLRKTIQRQHKSNLRFCDLAISFCFLFFVSDLGLVLKNGEHSGGFLWFVEYGSVSEGGEAEAKDAN